MKRARRKEINPPTPARNLARILALEEHIAQLEKVVDQHQLDLRIQLQRIGQLQADLDTIQQQLHTR